MTGFDEVLASRRTPPLYLGDRRVLADTNWGGRLVVPSFNLDVAIGVVRDGVIEPWTTRLVEELTREGDVVVNVGAHFGYYAVLAALRVGPRGRVVAVDANPHIIPYLVASLYWSGVPDRVDVFHCAAWRESGQKLDFLFSPAYMGGSSAQRLWKSATQRFPVASSLGEALWDDRFVDIARDSNGRISLQTDRVVPYQVETRAIDEICADVSEVHLIHMDIEGAEAFALGGARALIARSPDIRIVFEWSASRYILGSDEARAAFHEIWSWLAENGFYVRMLQPRTAPDGAIFVTDPVNFEHMITDANADYVAIRAHNDPWL